MTVSPGDQITGPFQYQFGTFLFGSRTSYITANVTGLLAAPPVRTGDIEYSNDHGSATGPMNMGKRATAFDIKIDGLPGTDIEAKMQLLRAAFQVPRLRYSRAETVMAFLRPGANMKYFMARCTKSDFASTYDVAHGLAAGSVELTATDPRLYDVNLGTQVISLGIGVASNSGICTGFGDFLDGARPLITLTGPFTNPRIQNVADDGRTIRLDLTIGATDVLAIDVASRSVMLSLAGGGFVDAMQYVRSDNQWWNILPGDNNIIATRTSTGATGSCRLEWHDTYA